MTGKSKQGRIRSFGERLRERIDADLAVKQMMAAINGDIELSQTQAQMIRLALDKCLPNLQAVAVAVHNSEPQSRHDVDAMLLAAGINPALAFDAIDGQSTMVDIEQPKAVEAIEHAETAKQNERAS